MSYIEVLLCMLTNKNCLEVSLYVLTVVGNSTGSLIISAYSYCTYIFHMLIAVFFCSKLL